MEDTLVPNSHAMLRSATNDCTLLPAPTMSKPLMMVPLPSEPPPPPLEGSVVSSDESDNETEANASLLGVSAIESATAAASPLREPLRFSFVGYTIWLHLSQTNSDLDRALHAAAKRDGLLPIPAPHVTVVYGMTHLTEEEARAKFLNEVGGVRGRVRSWPKLRTKGLLFDRSFDGVDGESMDMAWMEITLATSPAHESLVDSVYDIFHPPSGSESKNLLGGRSEDSPATPLPERPRPWTPHLSLAYDNPDEDSPLSLGAAVRLTSDFPSLLEVVERDVTAISLWRTQGRMEEWVELERFELDV